MEIIIFIVVCGLFYLIAKSLKKKTDVNNVSQSEILVDSTISGFQGVHEPVQDPIDYAMIEKAKQEARLKNIKNPDIDKPFAKISVPNVNEIPIIIPDQVEDVKELSDKPKKKRTYKKKIKDENNTE